MAQKLEGGGYESPAVPLRKPNNPLRVKCADFALIGPATLCCDGSSVSIDGEYVHIEPLTASLSRRFAPDAPHQSHCANCDQGHDCRAPVRKVVRTVAGAVFLTGSKTRHTMVSQYIRHHWNPHSRSVRR
jgi:hypothetical protein